MPVLHYLANDNVAGGRVGAAGRAAPTPTTIRPDSHHPGQWPVHRRQRQVYNAVLRILRAVSKAATPGKLPKQWQKEAEALVEQELVAWGC